MRALRAMTFNLRRDVATDGVNGWRFRRDPAAALVLRHRPDVLGTQELLPHQLRELEELLEGYARVGGCRRGTGADEHTAIFYDASRFEVRDWGDVWLSETPEVPASASWGNELPRHATWARLVERGSREEVVVVNTHFDHRSESSRLRSARFLADRFPGALLMGDFNAEPGGNVHASFLLSGFQDAGLDEPGGTFHGFSGWGRDRLDWVLVPAGWEVVSHRVVRERPLGRCVSDHDPVLVEVVPPGLVEVTRRVPVEEPVAAPAREAAPGLEAKRE